MDGIRAPAARRTWPEFRALPAEGVTADIHRVTKWSKLTTRWKGISVDTLLHVIETSAVYLIAFAENDYTTNLPMADVMEGQAWVAFEYDGVVRRRLSHRHGLPPILSIRCSLVMPYLQRVGASRSRSIGSASCS
jgi:DMSO/TMAO reductase YedYZ molybdopterin-dependent catalytic subunit